jgi:hypothetical protein
MKENQMSEFQNKLDEAFGKAENFEDVLKQGVKDAVAPGPGEAQKAEEPVKPEQPVKEEVETPEVEASAVEATETTQLTEEEAEAQTLTEEEKKEKEEKEKGHRDLPAEKRIAKVIKEREEARLKEQQANAERDRFREELETLRRSKQVEPTIDPEAPNPANYPEGDKDIDFRVDTKLYQRDQSQKAKAFQSHLQELVAKHPDAKEFLDMDVQRNRSGIPTANAAVSKLIQESENPIELRYYLLSNSDEAIRIARMDPLQTAKAIGRIEAKLEAPQLVPETEVKPKKPLPTPITPVKATKPNAVAGSKNFGFTEY